MLRMLMDKAENVGEETGKVCKKLGIQRKNQKGIYM